jgi:xylulose-5-phosphate/fructose-6-phosphate phosphoketolase
LPTPYLEGTYTEYYHSVTQDAEGMRRLFKQFSFPGGIPSHAAPETPGSIHEGGELGYVLSHAYGAAFDNPDLIVAAVIGDGEAETGPLCAGWHGNKFLNPARDGAVLPILHLNGYKIANPCYLARIPREEFEQYLRGMGYAPRFVEGHEPPLMHQQMAAAVDDVAAEIARIQRDARRAGFKKRPAWPMIVLRSPKGWTCPQVIDGKQCEDYWRAHQVPMGDMEKPSHVRILEQWMKSYRPEELFDKSGSLVAELAALPPKGPRRMSDNPHANGGRLLRDLQLPDFRDYAVKSKAARRRDVGGHACDGPVPARRHEGEHGCAQLSPVQSRREQLQPLAGRARRHEPLLRGGDIRQRRPPFARRTRDGGALRAPVPGLARRLSPHGASRVLQLL